MMGFLMTLESRVTQTPISSLIFFGMSVGELFLISACLCSGQAAETAKPEEAPLPPGLVQVDKAPAKGFLYPFYLYVPPKLRDKGSNHSMHTLLVLPNNTGKADDDFSIHDRSARRLAEEWRPVATQLKVAMLVPVFPRPKSDWRVYTHALDRDSLITENAELKRLDLQLIAMIEEARERLRSEGVRVRKRVLMYGFSASGMFTNRFTIIHPDWIEAAAFGSPGGWAMAPIDSWNGKPLRYPIGTADFRAVTHRKLDRKQLKKTPMFLFMGSTDTNDSVIYRDSYEQEDQDLIFSLFGKTLRARWTITEAIYRDNLPETTLRLYPGVGHTVTNDMMNDVVAFFAQHMHR
jgi:predicted esterase